MNTINASDAKNRFGQCLEQALVGPVGITKKERLVAVMVSSAEFEKLTKAHMRLLNIEADRAVQEGFIGTEATERFFDSLDDK